MCKQAKHVTLNSIVECKCGYASVTDDYPLMIIVSKNYFFMQDYVTDSSNSAHM